MNQIETPPIPAAVFLDTSIFVGQNFNFSSTAISTFLPLREKYKIKLLLPAVTHLEVRRHLRLRSREAANALISLRHKHPYLATWKHLPAEKVGTLEAEMTAQQAWRSFLNSLDVVHLDYEGVDLRTVMRWYDTGLAPFGEGARKKEFPDAIAFAVVEDFARIKSSYVAVVSADKAFKEACERTTQLHYFESLPRLSERLLAADSEFPIVREAVEHYREALDVGIAADFGGILFQHSVEGYDIEGESVEHHVTNEVRVVALGDEECTVVFGGMADLRFTLAWLEKTGPSASDGYHRATEPASERFEFSGTAKLTLSPNRDSITGIVYLDLDTFVVRLHERPHGHW